MNSSNPKITAARAFVRSLNILLKYTRLYGFEHTRTSEQFETAWTELHTAIPWTNEAGLLLGGSGSQLLLDGAAIDATPAERSFAQLLTAAGIGSIHFTANVKKEDLERLIRAFPTQNTKPSVLAEQLKAALAETPGIRINEIRFVVEDASKEDSRMAARLTARTLGADSDSMKDWLRDPQKLLQLIAAAEGSRGGSGTGSNSGIEPGTGKDSGTKESTAGESEAVSGTISPGGENRGGSATYSGESLLEATTWEPVAPPSSGSPANEGLGVGGAGNAPLHWSAKDEDIIGVLKLLTHLGSTVAGEGGSIQGGILHQELTKLPPESQEMLRQALAAIAAQTPSTDNKDPMLLRLAEHLAIRFALQRYERGEVKVNAVRHMIDRMSEEIRGLRKILGVHEEKMVEAGFFVEPHADLLDRQFWAAVPEKSKLAVLESPEAWCIPARNVKQYVEELRQRGDETRAIAILENYSSCLQSPEAEARRRTSTGIVDLAELYASVKGTTLATAIQRAGAQLSLERDDNLQTLISSAFVRLAQQGVTRRLFPAMLQALDSIDSVEHQRPSFARNIRPKIGLENSVPGLIDDGLRATAFSDGPSPDGPFPDGLTAVLQRLPRATAESAIRRFNRLNTKIEMKHLVSLTLSLGNDVADSLRDTLRTASASEAAESTGLLSRLDVASLERWAPERVREWPRSAQDRMIRLVAMGGAAHRGILLANLLEMLDPVLKPLTIDEIGFSEDTGCIQTLMRLAEDDSSHSQGFLRVKAIEGLGRMRALPAAGLLRNIAEARHMFKWAHHSELRLAAMQSLAKIDSQWARNFLPHSGFSLAELFLTPLDLLPDGKFFRSRRYRRIRLSRPIPAFATVQQDTYRLEIKGLSLSGGIAVGEKHLHPGTLASMRIGSSLRPIRAHVLMRDTRGQVLGFEFANMDLDELTRLRKLVLENLPSIVSVEQEVFA